MDSNFVVVSSSLSHPGKKRPNNEDFATFFEPENPDELAQSGRLYVVADGVGGASEGERASRFAAENVKFEYFQSPGVDPGERLRQAFISANNQIYQYAESGGGMRRMATTMVAAVIYQGHLWVANVGDSRAYLIRDGKVEQINHDHNTIGELLKNGMLTEEEAFSSKGKNRLTRSIGGDPEVHVDVFKAIPLQSGDKILLCSDGLTRYARNQDVLNLTAQGAPDEVVGRLVDFANRNGGVDNVTALFIQVGGPGASGIALAGHSERGIAPSPEYLELLETVPAYPASHRRSGATPVRGSALGKPGRPASVYLPGGRATDGLRPYALLLVSGMLLVMVCLIAGGLALGTKKGDGKSTSTLDVIAVQDTRIESGVRTRQALTLQATQTQPAPMLTANQASAQIDVPLNGTPSTQINSDEPDTTPSPDPTLTNTNGAAPLSSPEVNIASPEPAPTDTSMQTNGGEERKCAGKIDTGKGIGTISELVQHLKLYVKQFRFFKLEETPGDAKNIFRIVKDKNDKKIEIIDPYTVQNHEWILVVYADPAKIFSQQDCNTIGGIWAIIRE